MRNSTAPRIRAAAGLLAGILSLLPPAPASAVSTRTWRLAGREAFVAARTESLSVSNEGIVRVAPALEAVPGIDVAYAWALLALRDGSLRVGTGNSGQVFSVRDRTGTLLTDPVALQVESLAEAADGTVYAGTAPDATILAIAPDGGTKAFVDLPERHVWALAFDGAGRLLAATGEPARLYRIDRSGTPELLFEGKGDHFVSMVRSGDRTLLGVDQDGLLYSVDDAGRATVLFDAPEVEVRALVARADGTVFAAINREFGESAGASGGGAGGAPAANPAGGRSSAAAPPGPVVYRISGNGVAEPIWNCPDPTIQAMAEGPDGTLYIGTGADKGGLFQVDQDGGDWSLVARPGPPQLLALARSGDRLWVATGAPGKVLQAALAGSPVGRMTSTVHDAKQVSDWGVLRWETTTAGTHDIRFRTRSGNTATPDDTWSDWSGELAAADGSPVQSPPARFLQWEAALKRGAELREVTVAWIEKNLAPVVSRVTIAEAGTPLQRGGETGGPQPVIQTLPGNVRAEFSLSTQGSRQDAGDEESAWARRYRIIRWEASDPNDDPLVFDLAYRGRDDTGWRTLETGFTESVYVLDSTRLPDGLYWLRVTASDSPDNMPGEEKAAARESDRLLVDNAAPVIAGLRSETAGDSLRISAHLADAVGPLKGADLSLDGKTWRKILPVDRIWDQSAEGVGVTVPRPAPAVGAARPGDLLLRVYDQVGNMAVGRAPLPGGK